MKYVCTYCNRQASDGNLWCTEANCGEEPKLPVLEYGESLADITIKKKVVLLRTCTIYEALRFDETPILLKVAHTGYEERLKREARFLQHVNENGGHPALPTLLSAQPEDVFLPYGRTVFKNNTLTYSVFEHQDGDILSGMLLKNPQPWYKHAGWIVLSISDAIELMHQSRLLHLCLNPRQIMVRFGETKDKQRVPIATLLDLGMVADPKVVKLSAKVVDRSCHSAYVAPEIIREKDRVFGKQTDVYGLGLLLREMFAGEPAFAHQLKTDSEVKRLVSNGKIATLVRDDMRADFTDIINVAVRSYGDRHPSVGDFYASLRSFLPDVPEEKPERKFPWRNFAIIVGTLVLITLLIATFAVLSEPPPEVPTPASLF